MLLPWNALGRTNRWKHFAAMAIIGDGVMAIVRPRRDATAWAQGPAVWKGLMQALNERPALTRLIGVAEVVGAVCWVLSHEEPE
ncbi:hypothetical protein ACPOL_1229 [Acidisarcina polymorpha]|uniref:Uncharacterized protein n=1 Tax=Acidisarcina polymorpha TaxID=2211140 RepID=A0A2Z5FVP3_9BACT|nr:hypothetical protein [Acidisarcina polymorpha]AXC10577.1 hypothetical protein ACPOL_1229 [Acidisarcina polymorpha]